MNVAWRFRIVLFTALALMVYGDYLGYVRGVKSNPNQETASNTDKIQQESTEIEMNEENEINDLSPSELKQKRDLMKTQITDAIKDSCLPKMLCEMASKPEYMLTEKEKDLLYLIRASMSMAMNGPPSKWHFAAHMGELMRYTGDAMSGPMGCANLWPNCPISSKKLMKLSYKVRI